MEFPLDKLPEEVLHIVFLNLSISDRLNACLVCKRWLETLNCKLLLKNIVVRINDNRAVPVFSCMSRNFLNFSFKLIIVDNNYYELFKRFSSHVEFLSFEKCEIWKREPVNFDDLKYDNLSVLRINDCELWALFPSLPNLLELYLNGKSTITDDGIAILQKTMKCLKVFSILCTVSCHQRVIKRFYPQEMTYEANPSSLILSFPAVHSFISERACTLKELYLCPELTYSALKDISSIKDLCLHKIDLTNCFYCVQGLIDLFKNQPALKVVNLNGISSINDNIIEALCSLLPDVEEVWLRGCTFTNRSLNRLFQLRKLNKLDISGGGDILSNDFNEAILNFKAFQIKSLKVARKIKETKYIAFDILFTQCKYLVYLDICCNNNISDTVIHIISKNLVQLEYLCVKCCKITDYGLTGQKTDLFSLLDDEQLDEQIQPSLSNLTNLRELNLNDCNKITDDGVIDAIWFPYLEFLYVNGCHLKLDTVQILLLQNPSIKKIYWEDNSLESIAEVSSLWPEEESSAARRSLAKMDPRIVNERILHTSFDDAREEENATCTIW